ncbi:MAG: hypothetical protein AB7Q29_17255 [Vicinamibacterales bacterium]
MKKHPIVAIALAFALAASTVPALVAQQSTSLAGTAKDEAKDPYTDYTVRARDVNTGAIGASEALDTQGNFSLTNLSTLNYVVELLNKDGKVVCAEGPFDMSKDPLKLDVVVDCGKVPAAWWLVGAAAAAGITAGVIALDDASPSR